MRYPSARRTKRSQLSNPALHGQDGQEEHQVGDGRGVQEDDEMSAADALENTEAVQKVVTPADLAFSPLWHGLQGYGAVTRDMHMRLGDHMKEEEERKISTGSEAKSLVRLWFIHPSRLKRQENVLPLLYLPRRLMKIHTSEHADN